MRTAEEYARSQNAANAYWRFHHDQWIGLSDQEKYRILSNDPLGQLMRRLDLARSKMGRIWRETNGEYFSPSYQIAQSEYDRALALYNATVRFVSG